VIGGFQRGAFQPIPAYQQEAPRDVPGGGNRRARRLRQDDETIMAVIRAFLGVVK
jgi:hypothetical protein